VQSLRDTYTDGIVVLHRGRRMYERYFGALQEHGAHACFSITKSYAATLAATLIHEGALDETRTIAHYLPEMLGTAYADATLRQVLDMQIGVQYSELYSDPKAPTTQDRKVSMTICARCARKASTARRSPTKPSTRRFCVGS
jgi:CubicO group peptidase (beta-lactamase class C family)